MTSKPTIAAGEYEGQRVILYGTSDTNTITLQDNTVLPGSLLSLYGNGTRVLGVGDKVEFIWSVGANMWTEDNRTFQEIKFHGPIGSKGIILDDNQADALTVTDGSSIFLTFDTTADTIRVPVQLNSSLADGTAPFGVISTTLVSNLNAEHWNDKHLGSVSDGKLLRYNSTGTQIETGTVAESSGALSGITTIAANSITLGAGSALSNYTAAATCTPTVTLVGGTGNVVPVYSTNSCRWTRIGDRIFVDVELSGDGGDEGAGTGVLNIALPAAAGASALNSYFPVGLAINNTIVTPLYGMITAGASTITFKFMSPALADFQGAGQNNATRAIYLKFEYEGQ